MQLPRQSFKYEIVLCLVLIIVVILNWISFTSSFQTTLAERAAFWFMRQHLGLGESPQFVLDIAGQGLPQPPDILLTWHDWQLATFYSLGLIVGLVLLALRLWRRRTE